MSGPEFAQEFAQVVDLHRIERERRCYPEYECSCGWNGAGGDNGGPDDGAHDSQAGADAHLSAALHAEVARWLGDEGTREVVARAIAGIDGDALSDLSPRAVDACTRAATAALAALTTTDQEDR